MPAVLNVGFVLIGVLPQSKARMTMHGKYIFIMVMPIGPKKTVDAMYYVFAL